MTELEEFVESTRATLQAAVSAALDRKKRLGQYAVIFHEGRIVHLVADEPILGEWRIEELPTVHEVSKAQGKGNG